MPLFHRFCGFIPLFIALALLGGCSGGTSYSPWNTPSQATTSSSSIHNQQPATVPAAAQSSVLSAQQGPLASVKVAILLPLSGSNAGVGQSMLQAAQLAVFDVGSDNFELISKDTGGTAQGAATAANAAMAEGATLILGPLFAEEVRAVKGVTNGRGINVLAFSTDSTLAGGNTYVMGFLPSGQVERIAQYAAQKGYKNVAVVSAADTYGTTVARNFESEAAKNGLNISRALSDPNAYDSVFIPAGGQSLASLLPRITNQSAKKLGTGLWDDPRIAADPQMNGAAFAAPSPRARSAFESRYKTTYGIGPVRIATMAYDATALAAALSKSGAANGGPAFTASALTAPSGFAGVDGILRFNSNGLIERGMAVLEIQNGRIVEVDPAPSVFR